MDIQQFLITWIPNLIACAFCAYQGYQMGYKEGQREAGKEET